MKSQFKINYGKSILKIKIVYFGTFRNAIEPHSGKPKPDSSFCGQRFVFSIVWSFQAFKTDWFASRCIFVCFVPGKDQMIPVGKVNSVKASEI